jgi:hypothetical protein
VYLRALVVHSKPYLKVREVEDVAEFGLSRDFAPPTSNASSRFLDEVRIENFRS